MIFLLFNRQICPIILNWRIFWKLVVHISCSVVSHSVALVLVIQSLVVSCSVVSRSVVWHSGVEPLKVMRLWVHIWFTDILINALWIMCWLDCHPQSSSTFRRSMSFAFSVPAVRVGCTSTSNKNAFDEIWNAIATAINLRNDSMFQDLSIYCIITLC